MILCAGEGFDGWRCPPGWSLPLTQEEYFNGLAPTAAVWELPLGDFMEGVSIGQKSLLSYDSNRPDPGLFAAPACENVFFHTPFPS